MGALASPAFWASLGVIIGALGLELPQALWTHVAELIAAASGIVGVVSAWLGKGTSS